MKHRSRIALMVPSHRALLAVTVLAALALRLAWVLIIEDGLGNTTLPPLEDRGPAYVELLINRLTDDQAFYARSAQYLAEGRGYREPFSEAVTARWPPGYPLVLSALFALVGPSLLAAQALNALLGAASVGLVYLLATRLFDRRVGLTAAALLAFFPGQIFFSGLIMTEVLLTAVLLALLCLLVSAADEEPPVTWRRLLAIGIAIAGVGLVRGEVLLLAPLLGVYWLGRGLSWKQAAVRTTLVVAGAAILLVPWTVRNAAQLGAAVVMTTGTGGALVQGHAEGADGKLDQQIYDDLRERHAHLPEPERQVAENSTGTRDALKFMATHPLDELRLIPAKLYYLFRDDPGGRTWAQLRRLGVPHETALRRLGEAYYFAVLWLALLGGAIRGGQLLRGERPLLLVTVGLWLLVYGFVYVGDGRYHFPLVPIMCILAALSVQRGTENRLEDAKGNCRRLPGPRGWD